MSVVVEEHHERRAKVVIEWPELYKMLVREAADKARFDRLANCMKGTSGAPTKEFSINVTMLHEKHGEGGWTAHITIVEDMKPPPEPARAPTSPRPVGDWMV